MQKRISKSNNFTFFNEPGVHVPPVAGVPGKNFQRQGLTLRKMHIVDQYCGSYKGAVAIRGVPHGKGYAKLNEVQPFKVT